MVQTRNPRAIKLGSKNVERTLWSRRYTSLKARRPYFHGTRTLCETSHIASPRFPRIEDNFNDHDLQTHIHDFKIVLRHGNKETPFRVFAKRGQSIPVNLSSTAGNAGAIPFPGAVPNGAAIPNGGVFQLFGDISFMRLGAGPDGDSPISMRGRDARMVDYIFDSPTFRRCLAAFQHENRIVPPKVLVVTRPRAFPK
ncbi:hypothetical protein K438DRAFT_1988960 [Mycena galopus ATCC 62051]|nr:hypothetical protein K438DRAFT_1988960 [Mycena galopus ATCC 62051]